MKFDFFFKVGILCITSEGKTETDKFLKTEISTVHQTLDSSVGRAGDCRGKLQTSLGHWFESGSRESFFFVTIAKKKRKFLYLVLF